jgi:hypothetical protein
MRVYKLLDDDVIESEPVDISSISESRMNIIRKFGYTHVEGFLIMFDIDRTDIFSKALSEPSIKLNKASEIIRIQLREDKINSILE